MITIKDRVKEACNERNISVSNLLMIANIQSGDFYQALAGKRTFFPAWRKRIAEALQMQEEDLFPEYQKIKEVRKW